AGPHSAPPLRRHQRRGWSRWPSRPSPARVLTRQVRVVVRQEGRGLFEVRSGRRSLAPRFVPTLSASYEPPAGARPWSKPCNDCVIRVRPPHHRGPRSLARGSPGSTARALGDKLLGVGLNSYISDYKNLQFMVSKDP